MQHRKTAVSLIMFIVSIFTFTMLQGFDTTDNQGVQHSITAYVAGPNGANCTVTGTKQGTSTTVPFYFNHGAYYYDGPVAPRETWIIRACVNGSPSGDGSTVVIKIKEDISILPEIANVPPSGAQHCLD